MNHVSFRERVLTILTVVLCLSGFLAADAPVTVNEYQQQLHQITQRVQSLEQNPGQTGSVIAAIPDQVTVDTGNDKVTVSYRELKNELTELSKADPKEKPQRLQQTEAYLFRLQKDAAAYDEGATDIPAARKKLSQILSRREFRNVHRPGLKETLLSQLYRWLGRHLSHVHFGRLGGFSLLQAAVYVLIGIALLILLFWTFKQLTRKPEEPQAREIIPFSPSARNWRAWLAEAKEYADRQDWRNAIHFAYWAGISCLESGGAWRPNRARTPREYLRLLSSRSPNYPPLSTLTQKFEIVWYGDRPAAQQDFEESLGQLEKLGCH
ncbi:MAG TPA: DUF4129 domain-containing protein [Candidatus Angelobacter sp.]|nr:DUF4129 domain-containing protein [Candidatus Angelobacter sp.]